MKKLIGLGLLAMTGLTAFAAPAAAACNVRREVVVVRHDNRFRDRRDIRVQFDRYRR